MVGWYGASSQLFQTLMFLPALVQTAWLPRLVTAFGRSRRDVVSRAAQAELRAAERSFDPIQVLRDAGEGRVRQLLPVKYGRMQVSPFAFFRGAVSIMAADLGRLPNSGVNVQLSGAQGFTDTTNAQGCVLWGFLPAGNNSR